MMIDTSLDAWNNVKSTLKKRQFEVYKAIAESPNHTAAEYAQDLVRPVNTISGRFGELRELGKIKKVEKRRCRVTQGVAWTWSVV